MALHRMNIFGIKVSQKYDFEFNKSKLDEILVQNVKSNKCIKVLKIESHNNYV